MGHNEDLTRNHIRVIVQREEPIIYLGDIILCLQLSGRTLYRIINAYIGLMSVMRIRNADFHAIPSLLF